MKTTITIPLFELSMTELHSSAEQAFPNTEKRQHVMDDVTITSTQLVPMETALQINTETRNNSNGSVYKNSLLFEEVNYIDADTAKAVAFTGSDGEHHFIESIDSHNHDVKVTCNCMDFYWRFAMWNHDNDSLLGNPPEPYQKKTGRPDANPQKKPGVCKHLMKTFEQVNREKIFI